MKSPGAVKLLHVITTLSRGGAENHLVDLVTAQRDIGYQVTVAYLQKEGYWRRKLEGVGAQVVDLQLPLRRYGDPRPIFRLRALIQSLQPQIVHAHLPPAELYTRLALLGTSGRTVPLIITKHSDAFFYDGKGQRLLGRWVASRASRIIAISEAVRNYMCGPGLGLSRQRIATIHYGLDLTPYESVDHRIVQRLRISWGVREGEYLIGTVARFERQKALHVLIDGFAYYLEKAGTAAKLVLVGSGSLEAALRRQVVQLGLSDKVIWAGFREDIPIVMHAIDLFALTSMWEGFGLVLLEAMAAGKPVVASHVSAIPEVVVNQVTGYLIPACCVDSLVTSFRFFETHHRRTLFGTAGRRRAKSHFTIVQMVEKTLYVYNECLGESQESQPS